LSTAKPPRRERRAVKNNLQAERTGAAALAVDQAVLRALNRNAEFQAFAIPRRALLPIFSRYEPGMEYGAHVDNALLGAGGTETMRADLAVTLFLKAPDSYDGGELVIELSSGAEEIKLAAGEVVVYPAGTVHRVAPVTRGVRLAAVTWVQSAVRDQRVRAILFDMHLAMQQLQSGQSPDLLLMKNYHNLLRLAAEW
jgi:PKHD-type hydroxylase